MATITGLTADRMIAIENASVVDGDVVGNDLILTTKGGSQINAGNVRGPQGVAGPVGSDLSVVASKTILDVGLSGQIRAGRQLTATDFTNMGLSAPIGLWNLSNLNDSSGNGRNLSNKGGITFATGIEGVASSSALYTGLGTQALYIPDTGVNDPFRIKTGSWGCWFRGSKKGVSPQQTLISKTGASGQYSFELAITAQNWMMAAASIDGTNFPTQVNLSDIMDNRWHFAVATYDGTRLLLYMDGILENPAVSTSTFGGVLFGSSAPLNIGSRGADSSAAASLPHFGQIDEAFVTSEVLSEDQVRNLYCVKIPHTLTVIPKNVGLNVRRRKRGAALAAGDFPTQPVRLYNFSAGSLGDEGSNGQVLTNTGAAASVAGVDGSLGNAFNFNGTTQRLGSTDAGLPSALASRSFGCWVKALYIQSNPGIIGWGAGSGTTSQALYLHPSGYVVSRNMTDDMGAVSSSFIADGIWHFVVVTEENGPLDGTKRKMYVDGRYVTGSVNMITFGLGGAGRFNIGHWSDVANGAAYFNGQIDSVFICDYVLDPMRIVALYIKGAQALGVSPKNPGDHVELMTATDLFCAFDTLAPQHQIDLAVA